MHSPRFYISLSIQISALSARTWICIQLDTVDIYTSKAVTVGFATAALFLDPSTRRLPSEHQAVLYEANLKMYLQSSETSVHNPMAVKRSPPELLVRTGGLQLCVRVAPNAYDARWACVCVR